MDNLDYDVDFDFSNFDFPFEIWEILPMNEVIIKTFVLLLIGIFGIIGNYLLIQIIYTNRSLHTPTNYLIFNMAVADFIMLLLCPGLFLIHDIFQNYKLGEVGCKAEGMIEVWLLITSVITLCFISYDRLTAIAFPMEARLNFKAAKIVIAISWIGGLILSTPLGIFRNYQERRWKNFVESFCTEDIQVLPIYWFILVIALVWIPMAVLVFCYSMIFWKLDQYERSRKKRDNPLQISYKRKFAVTLFVVVLSFVLLRLPFTTMVFIRYNLLQHNEMNQIGASFLLLWYISLYLIFVDCALTPVIYGVMNENFRRAFRLTGCYRILCIFRKTRVATSTIEIFTFGNKNSYRLEPRNPIVSNKKPKFHSTENFI